MAQIRILDLTIVREMGLLLVLIPVLSFLSLGYPQKPMFLNSNCIENQRVTGLSHVRLLSASGLLAQVK